VSALALRRPDGRREEDNVYSCIHAPRRCDVISQESADRIGLIGRRVKPPRSPLIERSARAGAYLCPPAHVGTGTEKRAHAHARQVFPAGRGPCVVAGLNAAHGQIDAHERTPCGRCRQAAGRRGGVSPRAYAFIGPLISRRLAWRDKAG